MTILTAKIVRLGNWFVLIFNSYSFWIFFIFLWYHLLLISTLYSSFYNFSIFIVVGSISFWHVYPFWTSILMLFVWSVSLHGFRVDLDCWGLFLFWLRGLILYNHILNVLKGTFPFLFELLDCLFFLWVLKLWKKTIIYFFETCQYLSLFHLIYK